MRGELQYWASATTVLAALFVRLDSAFVIDYDWDLTAQSLGCLLVLAPASAGLCAWDASGWRALELRHAPHVRPVWHVYALSLACVASMSVLVFAVSFAEVAEIAGTAGGGPVWAFVAMAFVVVLAHGAAGYALGSFLPRHYAFPLAEGGSFVWLAYPSSFDPYWVRNVTGDLAASCCPGDQVVAWRGLLGPSLLAAAMIVATSLMCLAVRPLRVGALLALPLLVIGLLSAKTLVHGFGPDPLADRTTPTKCLHQETVDVCVWPEHSDDLPRVAALIGSLVEGLRGSGLDSPRMVSEDSNLGGWSFVVDDDPEAVVVSLVVGILPAVPQACAHDGTWAGAEIMGTVIAYLGTAAGLHRSWLASQVEPIDIDRAADAADQPLALRTRWIQHNLQALGDCATEPAFTVADL